MKEKDIVRVSAADLPDRYLSDLDRLYAMTEEEIEANALSDPDNPPWTDEQLKNAQFVMLNDFLKKPVSIRLDAEIIEYFKAQGPRYQTRINAVLKEFVRGAKLAEKRG